MIHDPELTDGEIVERIRSGDVALFGLLVERYQTPLFSVASSRLGRRDLAEDAVQETFLCAFRWLRTYNSKYAFRTWLWTILLNQCCRFAQRERRISSLEAKFAAEETRSEVVSDAMPWERLESIESKHAIHRALRALPEMHANAVRLRFFGGLPFEAIAQALGCSLRTAKYKVKEGLFRMGERLREPVHETPPSPVGPPSGSTESEANHAVR